MLLRIVLIAGGLALMVPESITDVIGIAIIVAVFVIQYGMARKGKTGANRQLTSRAVLNPGSKLAGGSR